MGAIAPILFELVKTGVELVTTWATGDAEQRAEIEAHAQKQIDETNALHAALKAKWAAGDAETQKTIDDANAKLAETDPDGSGGSAG